jgi:hypothetical protein
MTREQVREMLDRFVDRLPETIESPDQLEVDGVSGIRETTQPTDTNRTFEPTGSRTLMLTFLKGGKWGDNEHERPSIERPRAQPCADHGCQMVPDHQHAARVAENGVEEHDAKE